MHEPRPRPGDRRAFRDPHLARVMVADELRLFPYFLGDAYVVDLDFSAWHESITLALLADHAAEMVGYRAALFLVEFAGVRQWDIAFNHHDTNSDNAGMDPEHPYWPINHYAAETTPAGCTLAFWGDAHHPRLTITCQTIRLRELPGHFLDQRFPGWRTTPRRFIRPSLDR